MGAPAPLARAARGPVAGRAAAGLARRQALPVLPMLLALALGGCVESSETVVVDAEGAGTVEVAHAFRPAVLADVLGRVREALAPYLPPAPPAPPVPPVQPGAAPAATAVAQGVEPLHPDWLRAAAAAGRTPGAGEAPGLRWARLALDASDPARHVTQGTAAFASLEALARGGALLGAHVSLERLPRKEGWRLTLREPWTPSGPGARDAFGGFLPGELAPALGPLLGALRHRLSLTLPVPVRRTNGALQPDGRTVVWEAAADAAATPVLTIDFVLPEEALWPTFRHAPDLGALGRRCLRPPPAVPAPARAPQPQPGPHDEPVPPGPR